LSSSDINSTYNNDITQRHRQRASDIHFQDVAIGALWRVEDGPNVDEEIRLIRANELPSDTFDKKLERKLNDHKNVKFENGEEFDPEAVTPPKDDMTTLLGMNHLAKLGTGQLLPTFAWYGAGTGTTPEALTDVKLVAEILPRVSCISSGYRQDEGAGMRFLGRFSTTVRSAIITEGAVFTAEQGGIPLFRSVFTTEDYINHKQYETFFSLSQLVRMISVR